MATSGIINGSCKNSSGSATTKYKTWIDWKRNSNDITGNTSNITVYVKVQRTDGYNDSAANLAKKPSVTLKVGGATKTATIDYINTRNDVVCTFATWTGNVSHAEDGTLSLALSCSWTMTGTSSLGSGSISGTATLETIPRASTVSGADAYIERRSTVVVSRKNSSFTHSIAYQFENLSGYIDADGNAVDTEVKLSATTINFLLPESFYNQIPNKPSAVCKLTCKTYSGSTKIGSDQTGEFTVTAAESLCKPEVRGTVQDVNDVTVALTGDNSVLVQYASIARCQIAAQAVNGASIVTLRIGGVVVKDNVLDIPQPAFDTLSFEAADSRGYTAEYKAPVTLIPYVPLTNNATVQRTDPTSGNAVLTLQGVCWQGNFGTAENELTATVQVNEEAPKQLQLAVTQDNKYLQQVELSGLDYTRSHKVTVTVGDQIMSVPLVLPVQKGIPVFDWGENDFAFNVPVLFNAGFTGNNEVGLLAYPVGSIYMSVQETSPADIFGGTWERLKDRFLLAASDTYPLGKTGGEASHKLTTSEMPKHRHSMQPMVQGYSGWTPKTTDQYSIIHDISGGDYHPADKTLNVANVYGGGTTESGGGDSHNNMPPYLAVCMWKRIA